MVSSKELEDENHFARKNIPAVFYMFASANDDEQAEEVYDVNTGEFLLPDPAGLEGGACTSAFLTALYKNKRASDVVSWVGMLRKMRKAINSMGFEQTPQLSSSRLIDVQKPMHIVPPKCRGNKRALLIGVNYVGQKGELKACHNDVGNVKEYLQDIHGFRDRDMLVLMDDGKHFEPTKKNILNGFKMLTERSQPGDVVFVHFSGHGGQIRDRDGDECDGFDESIMPVDFKTEGPIVDDEILRFLVQPMSYGVHATVLMDCCHSGTVLDLPYFCGPDEDAMPIMDLDESRHFETLLERIEFNDRGLLDLYLDDPLEWKHEDDFYDLNEALRGNCRIRNVYIENNFMDHFTVKQQNKLLKSIGLLSELRTFTMDKSQKSTFAQFLLMIKQSKSLESISLKNILFFNTSEDYKDFVEKLRVHPRVKKYYFSDCRFANKTERPPKLQKFKKPKKKIDKQKIREQNRRRMEEIMAA